MDLKNKFNMVDEIDVDSLMKAVDTAESSEYVSRRMVGEGLYRRDLQENKVSPVNQPSWNGKIGLAVKHNGKSDESEKRFRCGR